MLSEAFSGKRIYYVAGAAFECFYERTANDNISPAAPSRQAVAMGKGEKERDRACSVLVLVMAKPGSNAQNEAMAAYASLSAAA